jgi:hypothetical protein
MRGEIPHLYVMFSTEARETKFKRVKFSRYTKILKECFKIWAFGGVGGEGVGDNKNYPFVSR